MATEHLYFSGKVKMCRPYTVNEWGKFSTAFYPDKDSKERFKQLKIRNEWKTDEDGEFIWLNCKKTDETKWGEIINRSVSVIDKDGKPLLDGIGNGSDVQVKIEYYGWKSKFNPARTDYAMRWTGLRVDNLVPYNPPVDNLPAEEEATGELRSQPRGW